MAKQLGCAVHSWLCRLLLHDEKIDTKALYIYPLYKLALGFAMHSYIQSLVIASMYSNHNNFQSLNKFLQLLTTPASILFHINRKQM
jgi:phosphoribosyl 1,2-cyclic phosphodiesterase